MQYDKRSRLFSLSDDPKENILVYNDIFYSLTDLKEKGRPVHGGNGVVFIATSSADNLEYIVKICRYSDQEGEKEWRAQKRIDRFDREIEALTIAKDESLTDIVEIICSGDFLIGKMSFRYFIMEKCDGGLGDFLNQEGVEISDSQKLVLFHRIISGIKQLNDFKIYHRDIKYDNILFKNDGPKVADLGLVYNRDSDFRIYEKGEPIGPYGWLSPESTNKFLVEKTPNLNKHDCFIDSQSDVFQLGKLGWYIFNGNLPLGQILEEDFILKDKKLFKIIFDSLQYSKARRLKIDVLISQIEGLFQSYNI